MNELQVLRKQFDTIMHKYEQTQQRMELQCNEIQTLKTELGQLKNLQQSSRLVQFALSASNSNDSKVWIYHRPNQVNVETLTRFFISNSSHHYSH